MQIYPRVRALRTALFCGQPGPRNEHTKTYDAKQALVNIEKSEQRIEHLIVLTMSEHEHEGEIKKEEGLPPLPEEDEAEDEEDVCIDYDEEEEDDDDDEDEDKDENDKQDDDDDNDDDDDDEEEDNDQQTHHGPPHAPGPPPPHAYYPYPYAYAGAYAMGPPPTDYTGTLDPSVYTDASSTTDPAPDTRRNRGGVTEPFPEKLHRMLDGVEREGLSDVVSFFSHGRAFAIHKPRRFVSEIMPRFFRQSRLTSFQRQLNLYGFRRISQGPDNGGYYHELFLKGRVGLCVNMKRIKVKGQLKLKRDPDSERKFILLPVTIVKAEINSILTFFHPPSHSQLLCHATRCCLYIRCAANFSKHCTTSSRLLSSPVLSATQLSTLHGSTEWKCTVPANISILRSVCALGLSTTTATITTSKYAITTNEYTFTTSGYAVAASDYAFTTRNTKSA